MSETAVVTLLFTDLVGSTELSQRLGEDGADVLRQEHTSVLREAIAECGGDEVKHLGDGLMVVFNSPSEGLRCAVAMQQAVHRHNSRLPEPLGLRVGVHIGEVTTEQDDYFGTPVVVAERLCKRADGAQILVSDMLRALAGTRGGHVFNTLGPLELKGLDEAVGACELSWEPEHRDQVPFPTGLPQVDRLMFVGREVERERLQTAWKRAVTGQRQLALIGGEPGIGKTRLATEVALDAFADGAIVLFGRCDEDLGVPYQPFAEAVRHLVLHRAVDDLRAHVAEHGGEIGRLAPELFRRLPDAVRPDEGDIDPQADKDVERYRLFEATAALLEATAATAPVVLVLDDLHWATRPTLLLLRHLLRRTDPCSLLLVGTYRDTDLVRTHPFAETLADLRREMEVERISLSGLDEDGIAAFIAAASGQTIGEAELALVHALHAETEGNPFFVGQVLRHLVETGAVYEADGRWTYDGPVERLGIPEGVREVIGRRMSRLSEAANKALTVASVVGVEFDLSLLEAMQDASAAGDVLDGLDEALAARIIEEIPASRERYRFTHTLVRQTLYEELTSARRVRIHERVAEAIERLHARELEPHLAVLARHFIEAARAGRIDKAADYSLRAAKQAIERAAYEEAIELAERGLQILDLDSGPHDLERADFHIAIAEGSLWLGRPMDVRQAASAAAEAARAAGAADRLAWAGWWLSNTSIGIWDQAFDLCSEALASLGDDQPALRALMLASLAWLGTYVSRRKPLADTTHEALVNARQAGDPYVLGLAMFMRAWQMKDALGPDALVLDEGKQLARELFALAEQTGSRFTLANAFRLSGELSLVEGDLAGFEAAGDELSRLGEELRAALFGANGVGWRATAATLKGDFDEAEALLDTYEKRWGTLLTAAVTLAVRLHWLRLEQGRIEEAKAIATAGLPLLPMLPGWHSAVAADCAILGEDDQAREALAVLAADDFAIMRATPHATCAFGLAAEAITRLQDAELAERMLPLGLSQSGRMDVLGDCWASYGAIDRFLAMLSFTAGRFVEAETYFRAALELESGLPSPTAVARTQYWFARMLLARGGDADAEEAADLIDRCVSVAREVGMAQVEKDATVLQTQVPIRSRER